MADVMVNVSREDTLSSLNLECQACGTPVVTYDATGSKETVDGSSGGICVKTGDYKELFSSTIKMFNSMSEAMSAKCVKWISNKFEKNSNYSKYVELYKSILK